MWTSFLQIVGCIENVSLSIPWENDILRWILSRISIVLTWKYIFQADTQEELPERLLGTCRLNHLDISKTVVVTPWSHWSYQTMDYQFPVTGKDKQIRLARARKWCSWRLFMYRFWSKRRWQICTVSDDYLIWVEGIQIVKLSFSLLWLLSSNFIIWDW